MNDFLLMVIVVLLSSSIPLLGGAALLRSEGLREKAIRLGMPFGAGALLAAAFLGVFPEAIEGSNAHTATIYALGGFLSFFLLERMLGWFHHHESHHHSEVHGRRDSAHQNLVVIGDTFHNAIDGVAVGAAFLVSPVAGIGAALAVAAHEIPQEIGDFSILLARGMKPRRILLINFLSALAMMVTATLTFVLGGQLDINPAPLLAIAAGLFIYIAASDIIPDIHEKPRQEANVQATMLIVGVLVVGGLISLTPHSHEGGSHHHGDDSAGVSSHQGRQR